MSIRPRAPIGSLLKQAQPVKRKKLDLGRKPRERDEAHLDAIRSLPCLCCGAEHQTEAAHLRMSRPGKPNAGVGAKPSDCWVLPACSRCHRDQHAMGSEEQFWSELKIDPIKTALALYAASPNYEQMHHIVMVTRAQALIETAASP